MTPSGIDSVGAGARIVPTRPIDLFNAFGAEIDWNGLAIFFRAHLEPGMGIFFNAIRERADSIGC